MTPEKINLTEKFEKFSDHWNPRIVGRLNGQLVKLARLKGEFVWHSHKEEDELFLVIKGHLQIEFREGSQSLEEGEMLIVPKGVEHRPVAKEEVLVMLFEPETIHNTGTTSSELSRDELEWI